MADRPVWLSDVAELLVKFASAILFAVIHSLARPHEDSMCIRKVLEHHCCSISLSLRTSRYRDCIFGFEREHIVHHESPNEDNAYRPELA